MHKKIKIIQAPPPPGSNEQDCNYPEHKRPKTFNASAQTIDTIKEQIEKFRSAKASNPQSNLKYISLSQYKQRDPDTGERKSFPQIYNFVVDGRKDPNYYSGHSFKGRIEFPDNYPVAPPVLVVDFLEKGNPFRMVNFYLDGTVCHHTINSVYYNYPKFDITYIMKEFENLLYNPNPDDPANMQLGEYFEQYPNEYWDFQRKQAQKLPLSKQDD